MKHKVIQERKHFGTTLYCTEVFPEVRSTEARKYGNTVVRKYFRTKVLSKIDTKVRKYFRKYESTTYVVQMYTYIATYGNRYSME